MTEQPQAAAAVPALSLPLAALRAYLRSRLRGRTRLTLALARRAALLQSVPVYIEDWPPVFMDLRDLATHDWFRGSPWPHSPFEVEEQAAMRRVVRTGDTVYDVGANLGLHSALLSRLVAPTGHVFSFEPNPALTRSLERSFAGFANGRLFPIALSAEASRATLFVPLEDHTMSSLADWTSASLGTARGVEVPLRPLDAVVREHALPRPDFMKVDVEGAESLVFGGARETLDREDAPVVLFEANAKTAAGFGRSVDDARRLLAGFTRAGFRFYHIADRARFEEIAAATRVHENILAVPRGRMERVAGSGGG